MIIPNKDQNNNNSSFNTLLNELLNIKKNNNNNDIDDNNLIGMINEKNDIDSFYCALTNIHFSFFYIQKYINEVNECTIINNWLGNVIYNGTITLLKENEMVKKIIIFIKNRKINIVNYNSLLCVLFSARYVLNTLSNTKNGFYYELITNSQSVFGKYKKFFSYYLKDFKSYTNNPREIIYLTYKIINYIILSHLYFGILIEKIKIEEIKEILLAEIKEEINNINDIFNLLRNEFIFIEKNILNLLGIKNIIIFMNNIFDNISSILVNIICSNDDNYIKEQEQQIDTEVNKIVSDYNIYVDNYYSLIKEIDICKNLQASNLYYGILYDKKELFVDNLSKLENQCPFFTFLTSTNFCTYDDFKAQFLYNNENYNNYPLITSVLKNDNILELIDCIPYINQFINKVYSELSLKITKDNINKKIRDVLSDKALNLIGNYNEALNKIKSIIDKDGNININNITPESKISEVINIEGNHVNNIYNEITKKYNKFLTSIKIFKDNKNIIDEPIIIQTAAGNDYISFILNKRDNNIIPNQEQNNNEIKIKDRLEELIQIYSKRNRIIDNKINIYDGCRISYDYELIENKLEKEFIFGKKLFDEKNQRLFIFSNEIYNENRSNIITELRSNYQQIEINEEENSKLEEYLKERNKGDLINIYYDLQYIMINNYLNNYDPNKARLGFVSKILEKSNYYISESFRNLLEDHDDLLSLNNLIFFYEKMELKVFEYLIEDIKINKKDNILKKDKKEEIEKVLNKSDLNKDEFLNCIRKYILRYCIGNNKNKNDILSNLRFDEILKKNDIICENMKQNEIWKELKKINDDNNYVIKYSLNALFNNEQEEKEPGLHYDHNDNNKDEDDKKENNNEHIVGDIDDENEEENDEENEEEYDDENKYGYKKKKSVRNKVMNGNV